MSATSEYIEQLSRLHEGELSCLRRLAGRPLDATLPGFDLFTGLWWPLRKKNRATPRREPSWLVAKLFGASRIPHVRGEDHATRTLPVMLRRCEPQDEHTKKRFRNRFDALLCSPLSALEPHLHWALQEIAQAGARRSPHARDISGIDWVQLLDDLSKWDRGEQLQRSPDIRGQWAKQYLQ